MIAAKIRWCDLPPTCPPLAAKMLFGVYAPVSCFYYRKNTLGFNMYRFTTVRGHLAILSSTSAARGLSRRSSPCELLLSTVTHFEPHPGGEGWSADRLPSARPAAHRPAPPRLPASKMYAFPIVERHSASTCVVLPQRAPTWRSLTPPPPPPPPPGGHIPSELISVTVTHFEHSPVAISAPPRCPPGPPELQNVCFYYGKTILGFKMYRFTTVRGHLAILTSTSAARGLSRRSSPCELLLSTVTHFEHSPVAISPPPPRPPQAP